LKTSQHETNLKHENFTVSTHIIFSIGPTLIRADGIYPNVYNICKSE